MLDAAARMVVSIARSGGIRTGRQCALVLSSFIEEARRDSAIETEAIPENYWLVRPAPPDSNGVERVRLKGAVVVHISGRRTPEVSPSGDDTSDAAAQKQLSTDRRA